MNKSIYLYLALTHENMCYAKSIIVHVDCVFKKNRVQVGNSFQSAATVCAVWDISGVRLSAMWTDSRCILFYLFVGSRGFFLDEIDCDRKDKGKDHQDCSCDGKSFISFFYKESDNQKNNSKDKEQQGENRAHKIAFSLHFLFSLIMESR